MARKRSHTISIRLDEAEFLQFERLAQATGAQSVTALARMTVRRLIADAGVSEEVSISAHLRVLDQTLQELSRDVKELSYRLRDSELRRSPYLLKSDTRKKPLPS